MIAQFFSGDLIIDRRFSYARMLADEGDLVAACALLRDTLDQHPDWAAGWFTLGEWCAERGDQRAANDAWDRAIRADPADTLGAGLKRDLARRSPLAEALPPAFVETLFDQFAPRFDTQLVDKLAYQAPERVMQELALRGLHRADRAMDLGCGTGLAGALLRPMCRWLEGCDLSAGMLAQAQARGIYDRLTKSDIATMPLAANPHDLIVAVDVFVYLGALEPVLAWCAGSMTAGGVLAFSVETATPDEGPLTLRDSRRFAHSDAYLTQALHDAGFAGITLAPAVLRQDRGQDIDGRIVSAVFQPDTLTPLPRRQSDGEDRALA